VAGFPIEITATLQLGIKGLVNLLNQLHLLSLTNSFKYEGDKYILDFISSYLNPQYKYHFHLDINEINFINEYRFPIDIKQVEDGLEAGVYGFKHLDTGNFCIGSSTCCFNRLQYHQASFSGYKASSFHKWVNANGVIQKLSWSPLITLPNFNQEWIKLFRTEEISLAGNNTILAFNLYPIRILEQAMINNYKPFLNQQFLVTFNNFKLDINDFSISHLNKKSKLYHVWDLNCEQILMSDYSIKSLANHLGIGQTTVRNNLNWYLGTDIYINGENCKGIIREADKPLRYIKDVAQIHL